MDKKTLKYIPFYLSSIILFAQMTPQIVNPSFLGDQGERLLNASHFIIHSGDRVWLPFLQSQIYLLYTFKLPLIFYTFLPFSYFLIFLFILNKLAIRIIGSGRNEIIFTSLLLIVIVSNRILVFLGTHLYQEIPSFTLFYLLIYLFFFTKNKQILIFLISIFAMLTREHFWIYYIVYGIVYIANHHSKLSKKYILLYSLMGFIPFCWILLTRQPLYLGSIVNDTSLNSYEFVARIYRLFIVFSESSLLVPTSLIITLLFIVTPLIYTNTKMRVFDKYRTYNLFSLISIIIIILYIIIRDPWQRTPLNPRMIVSFIYPVPLWILICYQTMQKFPIRLKKITIFLLIIGIIAIFDVNYIQVLGNIQTKQESFYHDISNNLLEYKKRRGSVSPRIGIYGVDQYFIYEQYLSGILLYENKKYITNSNDVIDYDILITNQSFKTKYFKKDDSIRFPGKIDAIIWVKK